MFRIYGVIVILLISSITVTVSKEKLRFISVVFRHGNRVPDGLKSELYPKDPWVNKTYYPVAPGGLTKVGKRKIWNFGKILRKKYNNFLGNVYVSGEVEARSSEVGRTKMSLQLILAGLYPPNQVQRWNRYINWQPTETEYVPKNDDYLFFAPFSCPSYIEELLKVKDSHDVEEKVKKFNSDLKDLTQKTGKPMNNVLHMWHLYQGLEAEQAMKLKLPKWTKNYFPRGPLLEGTKLVNKIFTWNNSLKRLSGGVLLKKIIDDMKAVAEKRTSKKINLFSGHGYNVATLLDVLGIDAPSVPNYSSAIIIELILKEKTHNVKITHYLGTPEKFEVKKIANCSTFCPLEKFIKLMEPVTPTDMEEECKSETISKSQLAKIFH